MLVTVNFYLYNEIGGEPFLSYGTTTFYPPYKVKEIIRLERNDKIDGEESPLNAKGDYQITSLKNGYAQITTLQRGKITHSVNICMLNVYVKKVND